MIWIICHCRLWVLTFFTLQWYEKLKKKRKKEIQFPSVTICFDCDGNCLIDVEPLGHCDLILSLQFNTVKFKETDSEMARE